jgi:hypothetical protein
MTFQNRQFRPATRQSTYQATGIWRRAGAAISSLRTSVICHSMRGWMLARRSCIEPVEIDAVMRALPGGEVVAPTTRVAPRGRKSLRWPFAANSSATGLPQGRPVVVERRE